MHLLLFFPESLFCSCFGSCLACGLYNALSENLFAFASQSPLREHAATLVSNGWLAPNDHRQTTSSSNERPPVTDRQ